MVPVGLEPTHFAVSGLKSDALDHSANVPLREDGLRRNWLS
jgi:hypothetical protein